MTSYARQIKLISAAKTIVQTRSMGCGSDIYPFPAFVCRFRYIDPSSDLRCFFSSDDVKWPLQDNTAVGAVAG